MKRQRRKKWSVYGEYGGNFTCLSDAKRCAKLSSTLKTNFDGSFGSGVIWNNDDGLNYVEYENGKLVRDGWTINKKKSK